VFGGRGGTAWSNKEKKGTGLGEVSVSQEGGTTGVRKVGDAEGTIKEEKERFVSGGRGELTRGKDGGPAGENERKNQKNFH